LRRGSRTSAGVNEKGILVRIASMRKEERKKTCLCNRRLNATQAEDRFFAPNAKSGRDPNIAKAMQHSQRKSAFTGKEKGEEDSNVQSRSPRKSFYRFSKKEEGAKMKKNCNLNSRMSESGTQGWFSRCPPQTEETYKRKYNLELKLQIGK